MRLPPYDRAQVSRCAKRDEFLHSIILLLQDMAFPLFTSGESSQPRSQFTPPDIHDDAESLGDSYFPPFTSRCSHEDVNGSPILEVLPLLKRQSSYLHRTNRDVSVCAGHGSTYGSDVGANCDDAGEPLVRVQSGVRQVEVITMLWTRNSLIVAYVR